MRDPNTAAFLTVDHMRDASVAIVIMSDCGEFSRFVGSLACADPLPVTLPDELAIRGTVQ